MYSRYMEYSPKFLAYKFKWFANAPFLTIFIMFVCAAIILPFLTVLLVRINGYLVLVMLAMYLVFLVGILTAKYYYKTNPVFCIPPLKSKRIHITFLCVVHLFLLMSVLLVLSPIINTL